MIVIEKVNTVVTGVASFAVPVIIITIVLSAMIKRVNVYDTFVSGAKEGYQTILSILPNLIALLAAVSVFKSSGIMDGLVNAVSGTVSKVGILPQTMPIILIRPLSGSGALAFLTQIFESEGVDSLIGKTASVMVGTTETIFYTVAVYLGSIGVKKTRFLIPLAVAIDCVCYVIQSAVCRAFC